MALQETEFSGQKDLIRSFSATYDLLPGRKKRRIIVDQRLIIGVDAKYTSEQLGAFIITSERGITIATERFIRERGIVFREYPTGAVSTIPIPMYKDSPKVYAGEYEIECLGIKDNAFSIRINSPRPFKHTGRVGPCPDFNHLLREIITAKREEKIEK